MQRTSFQYRVEAIVEFTGRELAVLYRLASSHYDGVCRRTFYIGNFGYGWLSMLLLPEEAVQLLELERLSPELAARTVEICVTGRQVDHLRKVVETFSFLGESEAAIAQALSNSLGDLFTEMHHESQRLRKG
jgi:hypothetical protein